MLVVMIGVLIAAIDGTVVVLALPSIERDLRIPLASVIWVLLAYLLVVTVLAAALSATRGRPSAQAMGPDMT